MDRGLTCRPHRSQHADMAVEYSVVVKTVHARVTLTRGRHHSNDGPKLGWASRHHGCTESTMGLEEPQVQEQCLMGEFISSCSFLPIELDSY